MNLLCDTTVLFAASDAGHQHHRRSLDLVAEREARSGQVYDALILKCAERVEAETVYTWNVGHFRRVAWPEMAPRIRTP